MARPADPDLAPATSNLRADGPGLEGIGPEGSGPAGEATTARQWMGRGAWTILDQALFAGSNFLLNIWLARTLAPAEYGIYTMVGYAGFLLAAVVHTGFITEPQLVFGAGRFKAAPRTYLRALLVGHSVFSVGIAVAYLIAGGVALALGQQVMGRACLIMAGTQGAILTMWIMRRACYTQFRPFVAVTGGLIYLGVVLGGLFVEEWLWGHLTVEVALGLIGLASVAAAIWIYVRLDLPEREPPPASFRAEVRKQHTDYGRWAAPTGLMEMGHGLLPFLLVPIWGGLEAAGALRALFNLILPMIHIYGALGDLLMPTFVQANERGTLRRTLAIAMGGLVAAACVNWVLLGVFGADLIVLLYDGQYLQYASLCWLLGALPVIGTVVAVLLALLRAMERPRIVFQARAVAAAMAATVGVALIYKFAVTGAIASSQLALGTETIFMMVAAWSIWQHARPGGPPQIAHAGDGGPRHLREPSTDSGMSADSALHPTLAVPPDDRS
ncbi:MAG: hypothetical protein AAFY55_10255 [Bacteroidota bacterium]